MTIRPKPIESGTTSTYRASKPLIGILLMLLAMAIVPVMDGIAKLLSTRYPLAEVFWARYFFHLLMMLPLVVWQYGLSSLWPRQLGVQVLRGSLLLGSTILFFAAIASMPLANTLALFFIAPLVVTVFAPLLLNEAVGLQRWLAVLIGFVGVCVIIRPGFDTWEWGTLLALGAGTVHGLYLLMTRKLSGSAPPLVTLVYTALVGAIVMSAATAVSWVRPSLPDFLLMVSMGLIAACGHFLLIAAFDYAAASLLAPFSYSEIVMTTIVGFIMFGDFPDIWTWIGITIIVASGVFISVIETKRGRSSRNRKYRKSKL